MSHSILTQWASQKDALFMSEMLEYAIKTAVTVWVENEFTTPDVISYVFPDEGKVDRFIVVFHSVSVSS